MILTFSWILVSNGNQVIEINETQFNPPNSANEDVIEIIDLCATQMPNLNRSNHRNHFNNSVIEIFDSPSVLSSSIRNSPPVRRNRRRPRLSPYEETPTVSSSQNRRSQFESPITCPICLENVRNHSPVSTNCGHIFCKECLRQALAAVKKCPMCKKNITLKQFHDIYI